MAKVRILTCCFTSLILLLGCTPSPTPTEFVPPSPSPDHPVSLQAMLDGLEALTAIEAFSGWRDSASSGESQALDWVENQLTGYSFLADLGMSLERQTFPVFMGTEIHASDLEVVIDGQIIELPADGMRGPRDDLLVATYFDTDGSLDDLEPDPITVEAPIYLIQSYERLASLSQGQLGGMIAVVDYSLVDRSIMDTATAVENLLPLLDAEPDGIVLVTAFSNQIGASHGGFIGDLSAFNYAQRPFPPTVYIRMEDVELSNLSGWEAIAAIEMMRIALDIDVVTPAQSGNLIAHIPGEDQSQALILGAHIDSPNGPGAMDDGSGSIILLEVARALNQTATQPPTDVYLAWFGSEEIGLYGAAHFAATHQELLDRSFGMLEIDCLISPLEDIRPELTLVTYPYPSGGGGFSPWADWISRIGAESGQVLVSTSSPYIYSDNNLLQGFDVPNADLIYENEADQEAAGGFHYAAHVHDPYDTVGLIQSGVEDVLESMAQVVYEVVVNAHVDARQFHLVPDSEGRVVIIGTHTEAVHFSPAAWIDFGMELGLSGYDVDMVPFGQTFSTDTLEDAALVIVLPTIDYAPAGMDQVENGSDWLPEEIQTIQDYVESGGRLLLVNSGNRLKFVNLALDENEDRLAMNQISGPFGITFRQGAIPGGSVAIEAGHELMQGVTQLLMAENNGVPFTISQGEVLAWAGGEPIIAITQAGLGEVIVIADAGILTISWEGPINQPFWRSLARYISSP